MEIKKLTPIHKRINTKYCVENPTLDSFFIFQRKFLCITKQMYLLSAYTALKKLQHKDTTITVNLQNSSTTHAH